LLSGVEGRTRGCETHTIDCLHLRGGLREGPTYWGFFAGRVGFPVQQQQQGGGIASGLGGMVAAGAGIGLGHAVVGGIMGSMFGGGGGDE
jgi:hypothetical protein